MKTPRVPKAVLDAYKANELAVLVGSGLSKKRLFDISFTEEIMTTGRDRPPVCMEGPRWRSQVC